MEFLEFLVPHLLLNPHLLIPMSAEADNWAVHPGCSLIMVYHWSTAHKSCWNKHDAFLKKHSPWTSKWSIFHAWAGHPQTLAQVCSTVPTHPNRWSETAPAWALLVSTPTLIACRTMFQVSWGKVLFKTPFRHSTLFTIPATPRKNSFFLHYTLTFWNKTNTTPKHNTNQINLTKLLQKTRALIENTDHGLAWSRLLLGFLVWDTR